MAILAAGLVVGAIYGVVRLLSGSPSLDRAAVQLPTSNPQGIFPWQGGVLCVESSRLYCTDLSGKPLWNTALPAADMKAARVGDLTVAWGSKQVALIDGNGIVQQTLATTGDVVLAVPGKTSYAVVTKEEGQHRLRFYSVKDKTMIDEMPLSSEDMLGMGFFGENLSQLWMLVVDSGGTHPITKLTMYVPGKNSTGKTTGEITLTDELAYAAYVQPNMTYVVSTHTLTSWEHTGTKTDSKLVYGWNLEDALVDGSGKVSFLFAPSGEGAAGQISSLWYIGAGGAQYRIPLPAGCTKAMLKDNGRICVVAQNGVYSMAQNGSGSRFYPISNAVDSVPGYIPGKALVVQEKHRNYLINMP
jgi:hypothetical protein